MNIFGTIYFMIELIPFIIGIVIAALIPVYITILNIRDIVKKIEYEKKKLIFNIISLLICFLYTYAAFRGYIRTGFNNQDVYLDYNTTTVIKGNEELTGEIVYHAPIASWSLPTVLTILFLGIISYLILRLHKKNLPPLVAIILLSSTVICSIYMLVFLIQVLFAHVGINELLLTVFPINYILCSIKLQIDIIHRYKKEQQYSNKILNKILSIIYSTEKWPILSLVMAIPVLTIMICILILFGQRPDEMIRAFFETSDWNLSKFEHQQIPVSHTGHYLCTVSLKGHEKLVKPTRVGIRYGNKIIVNRQLCIANAFEDLIKERTPRFHHFIRSIYDKYGYPLSKHINKPWQADLTYIIMKPLEWIFLVTLYLFDVKPENRIAVQYIGNNKIL